MTDRLIIDTCIFTNPASSRQLGKDITSAFTEFLKLANDKRDREVSDNSPFTEYFLVPEVWNELEGFREGRGKDLRRFEPSKVPARLRLILQVRPPNRFQTEVPGSSLYGIVESMRRRDDRAIQVATDYVREAYKITPDAKKKGQPDPDTNIVNRLRKNLRHVLRETFDTEGMLDSKADVDCLLLAKELNGTIVSSDKGILYWADQLGIKILPYDLLLAYLQA